MIYFNNSILQDMHGKGQLELKNPVVWAFVAIGYAQQYPCRQPHKKMANTGDISVLAWVDAANIKTNPR
jgi:hypothetical protein